MSSGREPRKDGTTIANGATAGYEHCFEADTVSEAMLEHALLLAQLEQFYRCGLLSPRFGEISTPAVADLRNLVELARRLKPEAFTASRVCVLNPGFRSASMLVGGADADLLVDDTLIEIKVVRQLKFTAEMFRQLMGYFTLCKLGGGVLREAWTAAQLRRRQRRQREEVSCVPPLVQATNHERTTLSKAVVRRNDSPVLKQSRFYRS